VRRRSVGGEDVVPRSETGGPALPLRDPHPAAAEKIAELGARQVNLYRALANAPDMLDAWLRFAWSVRDDCTTPRVLRELMILRTANVMRSDYEWHQHRDMAHRAGASAEQVDAVSAWQTSECYSERERAALMLTDAMLTGHVNDEVQEVLAWHFSDQERVELVVTAGFYAMVPRVLDALRVPIEETRPSPPRF
jgi:4-carboxymuconolactone decarboxylase